MLFTAILVSVFPLLTHAAAVSQSGCAALGHHAADNVQHRFNLTALPTTKGATAESLFLHTTGAVPSQSWSVLTTTVDNTFTGLNLTGGAVFAYAANSYLAPTAAIGLTAGNPEKYGQAGPWPTFATNGANPVSDFCVVTRKKNSILAMNGRTDLFSLCRSYITTTANGVTALVYNASTATQSGPGSYDGRSCVSVEILLA